MARKGETAYSEKIAGATGNYDWPVEFDATDGFVGISQHTHKGIDRVLLSPAQLDELIAFAKRNKK